MKLKYLISALLIIAACDDFKQEDILPQEPSVPTEVVGVPAEDEFTLNFQWAATEGAVEYAYVLKDRHGDIVDYGKTSETFISIPDLSKGYKYTFEVKAVNNAAESDFCQAVEAIVGGVELQPYGTLALELYSMDGDVQVDTLTVIAHDAQSNVFKAGFKDVALTDQSKKFRMLYLTEGEYSNISFEIKYTKDGQVCDYTMPVDGKVTVIQDESVSLSAPVLAYNEDDFYSVWYHGRDITICGNVINRGSHPKAKCIMTNASDMWTVLGANYTDETNGGVLFIDNSAATNYKASSISRTFGKDKIIIGRYRSANQAVLRLNNNAENADTKYYWVLDGKVMIKNITLSSFKASRSLFVGKAGAAHGASQFYFEDCTLTNTSTSAGILMENDASWAVPSSMRFDNCILRANAEFISADGKGTGTTTAVSEKMVAMQNLKKLEFNNCVFAPATVTSSDNTNGRFTNSTAVTRLAKNGAIVALYNINHYFDDLDITLNYCTIYDMGASSANRGLIDVTTVGDVVIDNTVVYNSVIGYKTLLLNAVKMCPSASLKVTASNYENPSDSQGMAGGSASNIKGSPADDSRYSVSFSAKAGMFGTAEPNVHYFPAVTTSGASYDTKYWIEPTQTPE